jgi:hypothetical protein
MFIHILKQIDFNKKDNTRIILKTITFCLNIYGIIHNNLVIMTITYHLRIAKIIIC